MKTRATILLFFLLVSQVFAQGSFDEYEHGNVNINGVKIHYRIAGKGKPILLMHGWLGTSYTWRKVAPMFVKEGYQVIIPDMKGYGDSDKPENGYDSRTLAKEMRELLKVLNIKEKVHVVGWDMGALVAYMFAATYSKDVASLSYIDEPLPSINIHKLTSFTKENYGGYWHFGFNRSPNLPELLIEGKEREFFKYLHGLMLANKDAISEKDLDEYLRTYKGKEGIRGSNGWYRDLLETTDQFATMIKKGKLKIPVLAVGGQFGTPYTKSQMEGIIANKIQGGIIPNCGHLVAEERPEELFHLMKVFLK